MGCGIGHLVLCCYSNCVFVPYIVGKYSLLTGKIFPHFLGINSHNIREYFPIIYGTIGTCLSLTRKRKKIISWLWEIPWNTMRIRWILSKNRRCIMRNAVLESISHKLFIWLFVVYQSSMRIWEMKMKNRLQSACWIFNWCTHDYTVLILFTTEDTEVSEF